MRQTRSRRCACGTLLVGDRGWCDGCLGRYARQLATAVDAGRAPEPRVSLRFSPLGRVLVSAPAVALVLASVWAMASSRHSPLVLLHGLWAVPTLAVTAKWLQETWLPAR